MSLPPTEVLVFAPLIVLTAYVIFGLLGFGSTAVAVPLLANLLPLKSVIPMIVLLDCVGSITLGLKLRGDVNRRELAPLLTFMTAGLAAFSCCCAYRERFCSRCSVRSCSRTACCTSRARKRS